MGNNTGHVACEVLHQVVSVFQYKHNYNFNLFNRLLLMPPTHLLNQSVLYIRALSHERITVSDCGTEGYYTIIDMSSHNN
jgi:hypothetical protein